MYFSHHYIYLAALVTSYLLKARISTIIILLKYTTHGVHILEVDFSRCTSACEKYLKWYS